MQREYLIDGYNFLHAVAPSRMKGGPGNLERARVGLLAWIAQRVERPESVTVVFDASEKTAPRTNLNRTTLLGVQAIFAGGYESADELIAELIHSCPSPQRLAVVSNDREVQRSAKRRRAESMTCSAFEAILERGPPRRRRLASAPPEKPSAPSAVEVEQWLRAFGGATALTGQPVVSVDASLKEMTDVKPLRPARGKPEAKRPPASVVSKTQADQALAQPKNETSPPVKASAAKPAGPIPAPKKTIGPIGSLDDFLREMLEFSA